MHSTSLREVLLLCHMISSLLVECARNYGQSVTRQLYDSTVNFQSTKSWFLREKYVLFV